MRASRPRCRGHRPRGHGNPWRSHLDFVHETHPFRRQHPGRLAGRQRAQPPRYPLKDFFRNPERGYFRLSEDGKTLGFMQPASTDGSPARMNIFVQPLDGSALVGEPRKLTSETARDISNFFWKGPDVVLYQKDFGGDENFHVLAVDARTGKVTDLTPYDNVRASIIDDLEDDPDHVLVTHNQRDPQVFDVYRVNVRSAPPSWWRAIPATSSAGRPTMPASCAPPSPATA